MAVWSQGHLGSRLCQGLKWDVFAIREAAAGGRLQRRRNSCDGGVAEAMPSGCCGLSAGRPKNNKQPAQCTRSSSYRVNNRQCVRRDADYREVCSAVANGTGGTEHKIIKDEPSSQKPPADRGQLQPSRLKQEPSPNKACGRKEFSIKFSEQVSGLWPVCHLRPSFSLQCQRGRWQQVDRKHLGRLPL